MPRIQLRTSHLVVACCLLVGWRWWAVERVERPVRELEKLGVSVGFATPFSHSPEREYWQRFAMGHRYEDLPHTVSIRYYDAAGKPTFGDSTVSDAVQLIRKLPSVHSLKLDSPDITASSLPALTQLRHLCTLTLGDVAIDDAGIAALAQLKQLDTLRLEGTQLTGQGLQQLRAALPDCEIIHGRAPIPLF